MKKNIKKILIVTILTIVCTFNMVGCALFESEVNELNGEISGNTYNASFYSNDGEKFMDMSGQKINLSSNIVKEYSYSSGSGWGYVETLSSVVTVTIDGNEVQSCGSTMIFAENGLEPEVDFINPDKIESTTDGSLADNIMFILKNGLERRN